MSLIDVSPFSIDTSRPPSYTIHVFFLNGYEKLSLADDNERGFVSPRVRLQEGLDFGR